MFAPIERSRFDNPSAIRRGNRQPVLRFVIAQQSLAVDDDRVVQGRHVAPCVLRQLGSDDVRLVENVAQTEDGHRPARPRPHQSRTQLAGDALGMAVDDDEVGGVGGDDLVEARRAPLDGLLERCRLVAIGARSVLDEPGDLHHAKPLVAEPRGSHRQAGHDHYLGVGIDGAQGPGDEHVAPDMTHAEPVVGEEDVPRHVSTVAPGACRQPVDVGRSTALFSRRRWRR